MSNTIHHIYLYITRNNTVQFYGKLLAERYRIAMYLHRAIVAFNAPVDNALFCMTQSAIYNNRSSIDSTIVRRRSTQNNGSSTDGCCAAQGIFGAGTNDFIIKPVDESDLLSRLQTLVNIKRQSEALST